MRNIPDHTSLHLANSMAVRYANFVDWVITRKAYRYTATARTSGIDGCTSTVVGHVLSSESIHTLITGDVALL